jgi:hypothetical protein
MRTDPALPGVVLEDLDTLDPDGGVLTLMTCWRLRPTHPGLDPVGEKLTMLKYLPTRPEDSCPCGSGRQFAACCQPLPYWRLLCPDPDLDNNHLQYRVVTSYTATYPALTRLHERAEVRAALEADARLHTTSPSPQHGFWIYWGDPPLEVAEGILCFGDLELRRDHTLVLTALSDRRREVLLEVLRRLSLAPPTWQREPGPVVPKPSRRRAQARRPLTR